MALLLLDLLALLLLTRAALLFAVRQIAVRKVVVRVTAVRPANREFPAYQKKQSTHDCWICCFLGLCRSAIPLHQLTSSPDVLFQSRMEESPLIHKIAS